MSKTRLAREGALFSLRSKTSKRAGGTWGVSRDTVAHLYAWREEITWTLVEEVQHFCKEVMVELGYLPLVDANELTNQNVSVLGPLKYVFHS